MSEDSDHDFLTTIDGVGASVAERLLDRYGSAAAVLDAHMAGLEGVSGVGPTVAKNIKETTRHPPESGTTYAETKSTASASKEELTRIEGIGVAVAERLLSRFDTIDAILDAERFELTAVTGVGETVVSNIKTAPVNNGEIQPQSPPQPDPTSRASDDGQPSDAEETDGFSVENMVLVGEMGQELLLDMVAIDMDHATVEEIQNGVSFLFYRPSQGEGTVRVTTKGKLQVSGVVGRTQATGLIEMFIEDLPPVGLEGSDIDLEISNVVATATVDHPVPLEGLAAELHGSDADYDPGQFPGFSFTLPNTPCTFTLFESGKVNITGANTVEENKAALEILNETLAEFDPEALRPPNDDVHGRVNEIAIDLDVSADTVAAAHETADSYHAEVTRNARGPSGIAAMALYIESEEVTQSQIADVAAVSPVTIRTIAKEFRDVMGPDNS